MRVQVNTLPGFEELADAYVIEWSGGNCMPVLYGLTGTPLMPYWGRDKEDPYYEFDLRRQDGSRKEVRRCRLFVGLDGKRSDPLRPEVDHIDGNRRNDLPSNLEYVSHIENMQRKHRDKNQYEWNMEVEDE